MGTLGCINDMMRRDKENREMRKRNRERMHETRERLMDARREREESNITAEQLEDYRRQTAEKEEADKRNFFRERLAFIAVVAFLLIICVVVGILFLG